MKVIEVESEVLKAMIKRIGVVAAPDRSVIVRSVKGKGGWYVQCVCASRDETVETVITAPVKSADEGAEAVISSAEFALADCVASMEETVSVRISDKGDCVDFLGKNSNVSLRTLSVGVGFVNPDPENGRFSMEIDRERFLSLLKNSLKFVGEEERVRNVLLHAKEQSLTAYGCNGNCLCYATAPCRVMPGKKWEDACGQHELQDGELPGCDTAIPGGFVSYLVSSLSLSTAQIVSAILDNKYLFLRYDDSSIIGVRLAASFVQVSRFRQLMDAAGGTCLALEKSALEGAVRLLKKRLAAERNDSMKRSLSIHLKTENGKLIASVANNRVAVGILENSETDADAYFNPEYLDAAISTCAAGNVLVKVMEKPAGIVLGNGSVEGGVSPEAFQTMILVVNPEYARQSESKFASGDYGDGNEGEKAKDKKAGKKKKEE